MKQYQNMMKLIAMEVLMWFLFQRNLIMMDMQEI